MTSDILKKLKKELVTGITTEAQVVYLLPGGPPGKGIGLKVDGASDSLLPHREAGSLADMSATSTSCLNNRPSVVSRKPRLFCETHPLESRPLSHVAHIVYPTREHLRCLGQ